MVPMAPSWLKLGFSKQLIPALLSESPSIIIRAAHTADGLEALKRAWNEFAEDECDPSEYTPPDELDVSSVPHDGAFVVSMTFPKAYRESEPYYGCAVFTPPEGSKLTNDTLRNASTRYFLLSLYGGRPIFEEVVGGKIHSKGKGTKPDDRDAFVAWACSQCCIPPEPKASTPDGNDPVASPKELAAAYAEARTTFNAALQRFLHGEYETFSVKFPVDEGEQKEHLWLGDLKYYTDGTFSGVIEDRPKIVESVVQGQSCEVAYNDITDWQAFHQGKIHGNYSLRALIPHLTQEEAVKYRMVLAELPTHTYQSPAAVPFAEGGAAEIAETPAPEEGETLATALSPEVEEAESESLAVPLVPLVSVEDSAANEPAREPLIEPSSPEPPANQPGPPPKPAAQPMIPAASVPATPPAEPEPVAEPVPEAAPAPVQPTPVASPAKLATPPVDPSNPPPKRPQLIIPPAPPKNS